jgi:hypothetical protein
VREKRQHAAAVQTIETMEIIRLNAAESLKMAEAIFEPSEPSALLPPRQIASNFQQYDPNSSLFPSLARGDT